MNSLRVLTVLRAARLLAAACVISPAVAIAQPPFDSYVDTLYVQPSTIGMGTFGTGDTIWVGIGVVNTFTLGGLSFRLELPDTTILAPALASDPMPGFWSIPTRLVNRGLPFDKPGGVGTAVIRSGDPLNVITGVLVDFHSTATVPAGRGTFMELAFLARAGIQVSDSVPIWVRDNLADPLSPRNNLSDPVGSQAVYPRLRDGFVRFRPGPVLIDVTTSTGNDTLFVGQPGSIIFSLGANGYQVQGVVWAYFMNFTGGNWIGVLKDTTDALTDNVVASPAAVAAFATLAFNNGYGANPTVNDTLLYGMVSFGGPFTSSGELFRLNVTATGPGSVDIVPIKFPDALLWVSFGVQNPIGEDLPDNATTKTIWAVAGCSVFVIANCPGSTFEGGSVAIHIGSTILAGNLESLDLISISKDGIPTIPANAPINTGLGSVDVPQATELITSWVPAAGEAGTWEFCYEVTSDLGGADTSCAMVIVSAPAPDHAFWNGPYHHEFIPGSPLSASLSWSLTHITADVQGVVGPFVLTSFSGGAFFATPILEGPPNFDMTTGDFSPGPAFASFASKSENSYGNDAVSPDSVLGGLISFAAPVPSPATSVVFSLATSLNDVEGIILIDKPDPPGFPPASGLTYNDPAGGTIFPTFSPGCYALTSVRNIAPTVQCPVDCTPGVGPIIFGDPVSIPGFSYADPDAAPGPYTFLVVSAELDGNPAVPTNAPSFTGDTFNWQTSNDDEHDVGVWEFCVQVFDGSANSTNTCCFCVEVIATFPVVCFELGCVEDVLTGSTVCIPLSIHNIDPCLELGGFDILFTYDASVLTFQGLEMDGIGSVLEAAGWEFLTYRIVSTNPALVRIVAIADMNNSNHHPSDLCLDGLIANICFKVTSDQNAGCQSALMSWYWQDCADNTASDPSGDILYIITDPNGDIPYAGGDPLAEIPGGGILFNSCHTDEQLATFEGGASGPDGFPCLNPDTTKPDPIQALCFVNGKIKIICPGDIDDRGDLNFNNLAYEIADAVLYSNYFISGPSVFTISIPGQTAASDVNADGTPLTVADLVYLIRVITGDALPIMGDILGGGPKVTSAGTIQVTSAQQGANVSVTTKSDADLGAGLFVFNYSGTEISRVEATGRASQMDVAFQAENGELRVLVYNIEDGYRIAAGMGEILSVVTTGGGEVELVSVEAATFLGGQLQATLEAKVLPTQFTLKQNFPNPFNPSTKLSIDFPTASEYKLTIYNIAGQVVRTFSGQAEAGTTVVKWDATDSRGAQVATGVYFYSVDAGAFRDVRKMLLLR